MMAPLTGTRCLGPGLRLPDFAPGGPEPPRHRRAQADGVPITGVMPGLGHHRSGPGPKDVTVSERGRDTRCCHRGRAVSRPAARTSQVAAGKS